jgi:hypothetical protein
MTDVRCACGIPSLQLFLMVATSLSRGRRASYASKVASISISASYICLMREELARSHISNLTNLTLLPPFRMSTNRTTYTQSLTTGTADRTHDSDAVHSVVNYQRSGFNGRSAATRNRRSDKSGVTKKPRKPRLRTSCNTCHDRKGKCDFSSKSPCTHCEISGRGETCSNDSKRVAETSIPREGYVKDTVRVDFGAGDIPDSFLQEQNP